MKTKINLLVAVLAVAIVLSGCKKFSHEFPKKENKILLSKISGTIQSTDLNFLPSALNNNWTYTWASNPGNFGANTGSFQGIYSYARNGNVLRDSFLNKGHYDFSYNEFAPNKVVDNSFPGEDFGFWQFYFNGFHRLDRLGLSFSATSSPSSFEFYNYNPKNGLSYFIYGHAIDTPLMKVTYNYDASGNLTDFDIYLPEGSPLLPPGATAIKQADSKRINRINNFMGVLRKTAALNSKFTQPHLTAAATQTDDATAVTPVQYVLYLTAKVAAGNSPNPFSQQNNIFFYQTNRYSLFYDPYEFFISLMKTSPLKVEYMLPVYGDTTPSATQTFSYTFNNAGYPVTVHEERNDPLGDFFGSYTKDTNIEYTKSDE